MRGILGERGTLKEKEKLGDLRERGRGERGDIEREREIGRFERVTERRRKR